MSMLRQVVNNTALLSFAQILNPLTSVLLVSAIARKAGAEGLGTYSLVLAIFYMASSLGALGLSTPISRAVATDRERAADYLGVSMGLGVGLGGLAALIMLGVVYLMGYGEDVRDASRIMAWAVIPSVILFYLEAIFLGFQKAREVAGIAVAENLAKVALGSALLFNEQGIATLFVAIVGLRFAALALYLSMFARSIAPISFRFHWATARQLQGESPIFTGGAIVGAIFGRIDILIISALAPLADVGYYSAAQRLVEIARRVPISYMRAALPALSEALPDSVDACRRLVRQSFVLMTLFGVISSLGIILLGRIAIEVIFGPDFEQAVVLLQMLAPILIPASLASVAAAVLLAAHLERRDLTAQIVGHIVMAVGCAILVPLWGGRGAVAAQVLSQVVFALSLAYMLRAGAKTNASVSEVIRMGPRDAKLKAGVSE